MKKLIGLMALLAFVAGLIFITNDDAFARRKKKEKKEEPKVEETAQAPEVAQAPEATLIYAFSSAEEMGEFEQLYVSKQATFGRMGVLQAYFAMEQNNLLGVDAQMEERFGFKMDPSKMYDLNRDALEIREMSVVVPAVPVPAE